MNEIVSRFPGPVTIKASAAMFVVGVSVGGVLAVLGVVLLILGPQPFGLAVLGVAVLCTALCWWLRSRPYGMTLDGSGFDIADGSSTRRHEWSDVTHFRLVRNGEADYVVCDAVAGAPHDGIRRFDGAEYHFMIPSGYEVDGNALVEVLTGWQQRALSLR